MSGLDLALAVTASVCLFAAAQKTLELRRLAGTGVRRASLVVAVGFLLASIAHLFDGTIDRICGVPNLGSVVSDLAVMVAACAGQVFLLHVIHPPDLARRRARWCYSGLVVVLCTVIALFVLVPANPLYQTPTTRWILHYGDNPGSLTLYGLYGSASLMVACYLGLRYAKGTERFLRLGLRAIAAGGAFGLTGMVYLTWVVMSLGTAPPESVGPESAVIGFSLQLLAETFVLIGVMIPTWGPRLTRALRWLRSQRSYRKLYPLWRTLYDLNPELSLIPDEAMARKRWPADVDFLLYRQVIEIRDSQLALRPYIDERVIAVATELARRALPAQAVAAVIEASALAAGFRARASGEPPAENPAPPIRLGGGTDLAAEIAWLHDVAAAYRASPVVQQTLAALTAE